MASSGEWVEICGGYDTPAQSCTSLEAAPACPLDDSGIVLALRTHAQIVSEESVLTRSQETARSGGQLLVDALKVHGADTVFCVPGESYLAALDAFHDHRDIRLIVCRQEGGAANMAEAYGKLTGRPGIVFVTRGPGATNASVGGHT